MLITPSLTTEARPTVKALEYIAECEKELAKPNLSKVRREELEEDLRKIASARYLVLNGVTHFYLDEGPADGIPVVLVHGWDCSSFWWHSVTRRLNEQGYRTINYDWRGHGFTEDPASDAYTVPQMAQDLEALTNHLKLEKFHLMSFSVGALVATAYAAQHREQVLSVAFFNFGLWNYNAGIEKAGPNILTFVFSKILKKIKLWQPVYGYIRISLVKNAVSRRDIQYGMLSLRDTSERAALHAARSAMSKEVLTSLPQWVQALDMPTLLVAGKQDKVISLKSATRLAEMLPNSTFFVMPNCGHLILGELPDQVSALIQMHLARANT